MQIRLGRFFGVQTYLHWSFLLLAAFIAIQDLWLSAEFALLQLLLLVSFFACILLHELAHALAARHYGIPTSQIVLYPLGGVTYLEGFTDSGGKDIVIALAGPTVNLALAVPILLIAGIPTHWSQLDPLAVPSVWTEFWTLLGILNLYVGLFNLLPVFPMDGARIARGMFESRFGYEHATAYTVYLGRTLTLALAAYAVIRFSPLLLLFAYIFYRCGEDELHTVRAVARELDSP